MREGVDELDAEESQGDHPLRLHPFRHHHRHELRPQALPLSAPQPRLIWSLLVEFTDAKLRVLRLP